VAVVGDKMGLGYMWLRSLARFQGKLYSVQIDPRELPGIASLGVKNYLSLLDIPDEIDYVLIATPSTVTPKIIRDCIQKKVGAASLFTAGFAESGIADGIELQRTIADIARKGKLNLIGPNCMGIYNPKIGLRHSPDQTYGEGGNAGFISQSGTHVTFFTLVAPINGIKVSKSVSYGNAAVLDSTDFLEYLGADDETRAIGIYIEGVNDGKRFRNCLKDVAARKPVLIWKGGETSEGDRATRSHTGTLAGSPLVWDALIKQCGAIKVDSLDEMVDTMQILLNARPAAGNGVGLAAMTGGQSVVITDAFSRAGFEVPQLTQRSYREFASFFNTLGASYRNPLDVSLNFPHLDRIIKSLDILSRDENIDAVALEISVAFMKDLMWLDARLLDRMVEELAQHQARSPKPFITVVVPAHAESEAIEIKKKLAAHSIPNFPRFSRGANALRKAIEYQCRQH
jgi:acyl-CoA synthetase (NDP forming)